nr:IS3 family transposase [Corynebacterium lactis]
MMASVLGISRAGYYAWKKRQHTPVEASSPSGHRLAISARVTELFTAKHKGFAGARTIFADLVAEGIETTLYAVRTIMAQNNLVTKYRRKKVCTTIPDPDADVRKDYLRRMFYPPVPTTVLRGGYHVTAHP